MKKQRFTPYPPYFLWWQINNLRKFFNWGYRMLTPPGLFALEKAQSFWVSKAIGTAVDLKIADFLAREPKTIDQLARLTLSRPEDLYRLMRSLAGEKIFRELPGKVFANNAVSKHLISDSHTMKYMVEHQLNPTNWLVAGELTNTLQTGKNAMSRLFGMSFFEHLSLTPEKNALYNAAMTNTAEHISRAVLSAYRFNNRCKVADIGGGHGHLLLNIVKVYPQAEGILFDQPHVAGQASFSHENPDIVSRIKIVTGDFFDEIPVQADIYLLKSILHAFADEPAVQILKNLAAAMPSNARALIIEPVLPKANRPSFGKIFDIQLLACSDSGRERTRNEYRELFDQAGLQLKRHIRTVAPLDILEVIRKN